MIFKYSWLLLAVALVACKPVKTVTQVAGASLQRIDSRFDARPDSATLAVVNKYKPEIDVIMNTVVGEAPEELVRGYPEALLSNFTVDALLHIAERENIAVDFSLYNFGGLRSTLPKGLIRIYDIYSVYPFENDLMILTLEGKYVREMGELFARRRVEPMGNVTLVIGQGSLKSMRIKGEEVDDKKMYRFITNNFVGEGGDSMTMLTHAVAVERPGIIVREALIEYIKSLTAQGKQVEVKLDGRVKQED